MAKQHESPNRRHFRRAPVEFPITVIVPGDELVLDATALDLSAGGVRMAMNTDLPAGQSILLRFTLPKGGREALARGRVVLSFFEAATKRYAHGVAFTQIAPEDQESIAKMLDGATPELR
ncbi:MAG: PilZ domain-containing protein [Candidatus Tyrphobacter sp.]